MKKMKPNTVLTTVDGKKVYRSSITGEVRKVWWTKARVPGAVRRSRMPGGCGFRNNWEG